MSVHFTSIQLRSSVCAFTVHNVVHGKCAWSDGNNCRTPRTKL